MAQFISIGHTDTGTLIQNISDAGMSPLKVMTDLNMDTITKLRTPNGLRDSISTVLMDNIIPGGLNHTLLKGLTNTF